MSEGEQGNVMMPEARVMRTRKISASVDEDTWIRLWDYIKNKYDSPWRKWSQVVREAIIEYLDRHEKEIEKK